MILLDDGDAEPRCHVLDVAPQQTIPQARKAIPCRWPGLTGQNDLGGGATVNGGIVSTYPQPGLSGDPLDPGSAVIGDFGIRMAF